MKVIPSQQLPEYGSFFIEYFDNVANTPQLLEWIRSQDPLVQNLAIFDGSMASYFYHYN